LKRALDQVVVIRRDDEERGIHIREKAMNRADLIIAVECFVQRTDQVHAVRGDFGVVRRDLGEIVAVVRFRGWQTRIVGKLVRQFLAAGKKCRGLVVPLAIRRTPAQRRARAEERNDVSLFQLIDNDAVGWFWHGGLLMRDET
jgi:hypothetical protein